MYAAEIIVFHFIEAKTTESPRNVSNSTTHKPGTLDFIVYLAIDIILQKYTPMYINSSF